ncbi:MAG: hypothetical protein WDM92_00620 [Caulobacteraceae bacterium]
MIEPSATQPVKIDGDRHVLTLTRAAFAVDPARQLRGVLVAASGWPGGAPAAAVDTAVGGAPAAATTSAAASPANGTATTKVTFVTLAGSIGLALIGGLILNLMPCVFPVLGLKIVGFAQQSGEDRRKVTLHGLTFTAGVLSSFWILAGVLAALRAGGAQLGWGFQLQSPGFVFVLTSVMLLFALNLSGVFEFGVSATGIGSSLHSKSGLVGTFFTRLPGHDRRHALQRAVPGARARRGPDPADRRLLRGVHGDRDRHVAAVPVAVDLPLGGEGAAAPGALDGNLPPGHGLPALRDGGVSHLGPGRPDHRGRPAQCGARPGADRHGRLGLRPLEPTERVDEPALRRHRPGGPGRRRRLARLAPACVDGRPRGLARRGGLGQVVAGDD